jgi:hypothetical protein
MCARHCGFNAQVGAKYGVSWRSLWLINPSIGEPTTKLNTGSKIRIGREYVVGQNESLTTVNTHALRARR